MYKCSEVEYDSPEEDPADSSHDDRSSHIGSVKESTSAANGTKDAGHGTAEVAESTPSNEANTSAVTEGDNDEEEEDEEEDGSEEYTDEEGDTEDEEEEEEPVLKYEKIGKAVGDILEKDSASVIAVGPTYFVSNIHKNRLFSAYTDNRPSGHIMD